MAGGYRGLGNTKMAAAAAPPPTTQKGARIADGLTEGVWPVSLSVPIACSRLPSSRAGERKSLQAVFNVVDGTNAGELDWMELRHALFGLGFALSPDEVQDLVAKVSPGGMLNFEQFVELVEDLSLSDRDVRRELAEAFRVLDAGNTGVLSVDALRAFCLAANEHLPESELRLMVQEANTSSTGAVTLDEFIRVMLRTNLYR